MSYGVKMSNASLLNYVEDGHGETGRPPRVVTEAWVSVFVLPERNADAVFKVSFLRSFTIEHV